MHRAAWLCVVLLAMCIPAHAVSNLYTAFYQTAQANPTSKLSSARGWSSPYNAAGDPCNPEWQGVKCFLKQPFALNLSNMGITFLPDAFFNVIKTVHSVDLSHNAIAQPITLAWSDIGAQRSGTVDLIDFSYNNINGPLPASFLSSAGVVTLRLGHNQIQGTIPAFGNMISLWELDLSHNLLTGTVPPTIAKATALDTIDLSHNGLTDIAAAGIPNLAQTISLDLSNNKFAGSFPDLVNLLDLFDLNVANNSFSGFLPSFLQSYTDFVNLEGNKFRCPYLPCQDGIDCVINYIQTPCNCPCAPGGICSNGTLSCTCDINHFGFNCSGSCPSYNATARTSCGQGSCDSGENSTGVCTCFGNFVKTATNACDQCAGGFYGRTCQPECPGPVATANGTVHCSGNGWCFEGVAGNGTCKCKLGYQAPDCAVCAPGYFGANCSNECPGSAKNACNSHGTCSDGMSGTGVCTCVNHFVGSDCSKCAPGWSGPNCTIECPGKVTTGNSTVYCSGHGTCSDGQSGSGICTCALNFQAPNCDQCMPGFWGSQCLSECPGGARNVCSGHGSCSDKMTGNGTCACTGNFVTSDCSKCQTGFSGLNCQNECPGKVTTGNSTVYCSGHGTCSDGLYGSAACTCAPRFQGADCSQCVPGSFGANCSPCPGVNTTCSSHGTCSDGRSGSGACSCAVGFAGSDCSTCDAVNGFWGSNCQNQDPFVATASDSGFFYWSFYADTAKATYVIMPKHAFTSVAYNKTSTNTVEIYVWMNVPNSRVALVYQQTSLSSTFLQQVFGNVVKKMTIYIRTRDVISSVGKYYDESLDYYNFKISN